MGNTLFSLSLPLPRSHTLSNQMETGKVILPVGFLLFLPLDSQEASARWEKQGPAPHSPQTLPQSPCPSHFPVLLLSGAQQATSPVPKFPEVGGISAAMEPLSSSKRIQGGKRNPNRHSFWELKQKIENKSLAQLDLMWSFRRQAAPPAGSLNVSLLPYPYKRAMEKRLCVYLCVSTIKKGLQVKEEMK